MPEKKGEILNITDKMPRAKIMSKPLPQILDELDDNIRTAAEAARKAGEAAKVAKDAASQATKASAEVEKWAEEIRQAGTKSGETALLERVEFLEERLDAIEALLPSEKTIILREISKKDAEKEIRQLFSEGKILYYSDIAEKLGLDLQLVVEICNELQKSGEIKIDDNALQSR